MRYFVSILAIFGIFSAASGQTSWTKWGSAPVLPVGGSGQWDNYLCVPASVVTTDSGYAMYYNGTDGVVIWLLGIATSPDGYTWTRHDSNPLDNPDGWAPYPPYSPIVLPDVGTGGWMMFATRYGAGEFYDVCHALSDDGIHWWMDPAEPVLEAGSSGAWDHTNIFMPSVFDWRDTLWMTYSAYDEVEGITGMGLAFSLDQGETWTRDSTNNPVFVPLPSPAWDHSLWDIRVAMWSESLFVMLYTGASTSQGMPSIGVATSSDLRHWTRAPNNPVLRRGTPSAWDNSYLYQPILADVDGQKMIYYCGVRSTGVGAIGLAVQSTSDMPDGQSAWLPQDIALTAFPNPFNPSTTIVFTLPQPSHIQLTVWNILGRRVALLKDDWLPSGESKITWVADDLSSGTYYVRLDADGMQIVRPIMLVK